VHRADAESKIHDQAYADARDKYDIFEADNKYLEHQSNIFAEGLSGKASLGELITSGVGLVGIGGKHAIEKHLDKTLYPSFSGKQWLRLTANSAMFDISHGILDIMMRSGNKSIMILNTDIYLQTNLLQAGVQNELLKQIVQAL
jgi:hypothetical protein